MARSEYFFVRRCDTLYRYLRHRRCTVSLRLGLGLTKVSNGYRISIDVTVNELHCTMTDDQHSAARRERLKFQPVCRDIARIGFRS